MDGGWARGQGDEADLDECDELGEELFGVRAHLVLDQRPGANRHAVTELASTSRG